MMVGSICFLTLGHFGFPKKKVKIHRTKLKPTPNVKSFAIHNPDDLNSLWLCISKKKIESSLHKLSKNSLIVHSTYNSFKLLSDYPTKIEAIESYG